MIAAVVLLVALPTRVVAVTARTKNPVVIQCPVGATTRIVFPEPVMASLSPEMRTKLGMAWEPGGRSRVAVVRPAEHPSQAVMQVTGRQLGRFLVRLESVAKGASSEIRLTQEVPASPGRQAVQASPGSLSSVSSPPIASRAAPPSKTQGRARTNMQEGGQPPAAAQGAGRASSASSKPASKPIAGAAAWRAASIRSPRELSVQTSDGFVKLRNEGTTTITAARVVLVGSDGRRFAAKDVSITPAWETRVAYEEFSPPIPEHLEILSAELLDSPAARVSPVPAAPAPSRVAEETQTADRPLDAPAIGTVAIPKVQPSEGPTDGLLDREILRARLRPVGRVESMPGQREVELADILEGENFLWLRFNVRGGARARVGEVSWEHGPITSFTTEVVNKGRDLLVVVQLPKARTTKRTRVTLRLDDGVRKFPLSAPWLSSLVKDLLGF